MSSADPEREEAIRACLAWVGDVRVKLDEVTVALQAALCRLPLSENQLSVKGDEVGRAVHELLSQLGGATALVWLDHRMRQPPENQEKHVPTLPEKVPEPPKRFRRTAGDGGEGNRGL